MKKILNWIKSNPKQEILYITALLVSLTIFLTFVFRKPTIVPITKDNKDLITEVKTFRDKEGDIVHQLKQKVINIEEVRKRSDSLANLLKLKSKDIKSVDQLYSKSDTTFNTTPSLSYSKDSLEEFYTVRKKDNYIDIKAVAGKHSGYISFSSIDTLTRITSTKRHFFKPDETLVTIKNSSPYNQIVSGYSFSVKEKQTLFDISLQAGYNPFTKQPYIGIGISKSIFKIKK